MFEIYLKYIAEDKITQPLLHSMNFTIGIYSHFQPDNVDDYFDIHSSSAVTSDRTLAKLETPRMDQEALNSALTGVDLGYTKERKALYEEHRGLFNQWMFNLW